jgi:hypothetical protein
LGQQGKLERFREGAFADILGSVAIAFRSSGRKAVFINVLYELQGRRAGVSGIRLVPSTVMYAVIEF